MDWETLSERREKGWTYSVVPEIVVDQFQVHYGETQLVEPPLVQVVQVGVLDVEHVVEHGVELVLERVNHALERLHLLAHHQNTGLDHGPGVVAARAWRDAAAHRTVDQRVVQYELAAHAARD